MSIEISSEFKKQTFKEYGGSETNTGSIEAQVAILTKEIKVLTEHLHRNKKDQACRRALLGKVGKRRRFLTYIQKKDIQGYRELIQNLSIRK